MKKKLVQNKNRRSVMKGFGAASLLAVGGSWGFPAIAQNRPLKVGILAPRAGIAATIGECGLRGVLFAVDKINKSGVLQVEKLN